MCKCGTPSPSRKKLYDNFLLPLEFNFWRLPLDPHCFTSQDAERKSIERNKINRCPVNTVFTVSPSDFHLDMHHGRLKVMKTFVKYCYSMIITPQVIQSNRPVPTWHCRKLGPRRWKVWNQKRFYFYVLFTFLRLTTKEIVLQYLDNLTHIC